MPNGFSKQEFVAFEQITAGFDDALVLSNNVNVYKVDDVTAERSSNTIWRPMPYILPSFDGSDATNNFKDTTQLSVPASINIKKHSPWSLTGEQLRDALQEDRLMSAATQKLGSDINIATLNAAGNFGSLFVKRASAASGFDDVAQCDSMMNEQGIPMMDRCLALSSRDYNGLASNLAASTRSFGNKKSDTAYERAYVGNVSGFETFKLDYAINKAAAAGGGGITMSTLTAANNYWVPRATSVSATGEVSNVDNRFQTITVSSTTNVVAGDAFTIANCLATNHITKQSTGQPKTFRVVSVPSSTTLVITPAIVSLQGGTDAERQYQNVTFSSTASNAAITFLNTAAGFLNPFWHKDAIEIIPGRLGLQPYGIDLLQTTTKNGFQVTMQRQTDINTQLTKYRIDVLFGVVNKNPQMSGVIMFSQP
jgi:hypothetical protein